MGAASRDGARIWEEMKAELASPPFRELGEGVQDGENNIGPGGRNKLGRSEDQKGGCGVGALALESRGRRGPDGLVGLCQELEFYCKSSGKALKSFKQRSDMIWFTFLKYPSGR